MRKQKTHKFKLLLAALMLASVIPVLNPSSSYAESSEYFNVDGDDIIFAEGLARSEDTLYVTFSVAKDLQIYDFEAYTEVPGTSDLDLVLMAIPAYSDLEEYLADDVATGQIKWTSDDYLDVEAGSGLFYAKYYVTDGVTELDRDIPIEIVSATISDDGGLTQKTIENLTLSANISVTTRSDYYTIDANVEGSGWIYYPDYIFSGKTYEIEIEPDDGYEILYVLLDYEDDLTDQVVDGVLELTAESKNYYFQVFFQPVYDVTAGDGGEHTVGDGESLEFVIDADLTDFNGTGVVQVDDDYLLVDEEWVADDYYSTITLSSDYLDTLAAGTHSLTLLFPDPDKGVARATFTIIREDDEEDSDDDEEDVSEDTEDGDSDEDSDTMTIPDTGVSTAAGASATASSSTLSVIVGFFVALALWAVFKKQLKN